MVGRSKKNGLMIHHHIEDTDFIQIIIEFAKYEYI